LTGKSAEGAELIDELLTDTSRQPPKHRSRLAVVLAQEGMSLINQKAFDEAESTIREALVG